MFGIIIASTIALGDYPPPKAMPIPVQGEPRPREISQLEMDFKKVAG